MSFVHHLRVRYGECDAQGVVFNANWLAYVDDALTEYFRHLGYDPKDTWLEDDGFDVMLVKAVVDWQGPAGFDDRLALAVVPTRFGTKSFDLTYTARVEDRQVLTAVVTYVTIDTADHTSIAVPDELRARLEADAPA